MKKILMLLLAIAGIGLTALLWDRFNAPPPIQVGMVSWVASGAVVGSSELQAATLFQEEHPQSRIRVEAVDDEWQPDRTKAVIETAIARGVRFFISAHPSKCAVASASLFVDGQALMINTASTSPALTGQPDFLLRIIPDAVHEQRVLARHIQQLPGQRLLVVQDTGNRPYTDPAFATFSAELTAQGRWQIIHQPLNIAEFKPADYEALMAAPYDAFYILAGSFQAAIGNMAQLFHRAHPDAPILLTPWARSPSILETAGAAIDQLILPSSYPSRHTDPAINSYFQRFVSRFNYQPHAMTIGIRQALELLDQAFSKGYTTPETVRHYLLSQPRHETSLGTIAFDVTGDTNGAYHFMQDIRAELQ